MSSDLDPQPGSSPSGPGGLRVGVVTQWYDPEPASAAQAGVIARALAARGAEVDVLTGFPNYPTGVLAEGYRVRPYRRETLRGIPVHRAPLWPNHDSSGVRRAANFLSYSLGATAVGLTRFPHVDACLVHSTPATAALPALALKRLRCTPYVVHIQDLWPQTVLSSGFLSPERGRWVGAALHRMCDRIYADASAIAVTSPGMAPLIEERGVPAEAIHFVSNWADERVFSPQDRDPRLAARLGLTRPFTAMYAGNYGEYQRLDVLIDAAARLADRPDIGIALVGGGVEESRLREKVAAGRLGNVTFVPAQPYEDMGPVLALGDVQIISLADLPLFRTTLPSKLQATLAAGRPVVAALVGDAAAAVRASGAGPVVAPGDPDALAAAIRAAADQTPGEREERGRRGRAYYMDHFSEDVSCRALLALLNRAAAGAAGGSRGRRGRRTG